MSDVPEFDEVITDDGALLLDRLVRSLHRNADGFLAPDERNPKHHIDEWHNAVCLYIYATDDDGFHTLSTYYIYAGNDETHTYEEWREIAHEATDELNEEAKANINWHGVYGWSTTTIRITPIRNGDLFIAVDAEGVRSVRVSFSARKDKRAPHQSKKV